MIRQPAPELAALRFKWPWRPYQARLLDSVDRHLGDDRLHIVAAPGAGKTSLGLEVFRRLGRPTLVLAPTLTIRDQWLLRLQDFLPEAAAPPWTSTDIHAPSFLTVTTYQALLARHRADARPEDLNGEDPTEEGGLTDHAPSGEEVRGFIALFRDAGVGTVVLDEAHHLKQEWWKALARLVEGIPQATLVSLTATPPYDATGREWQRYEELCGPIDDEISVPELVKAGTLCPHQDYVLLVTPRGEEARDVLRHDHAVDRLLLDLGEDPDFQTQVDGHPWVASPEPDAEAVLARPELAVALLVYLRGTGAALPHGLVQLLDIEPGGLPQPQRRWWQVLVQEYLFGATFHESRKEHRDALATRLRSEGLLWRRELRIDGARPVVRSLSLSAAKVDACGEIYAAERALRGDTLRQVVLTDYIRDEGLGLAPGALPTELGALPVFDHLVHRAGAEEEGSVGLVTGRVCLIHESRADGFLAAAGEGVSVDLVPLPERPGWLRAVGPGGSRLVEAYTRMMTAGDVRVLVGTRSLLGEGWDAPVVNSVVLASFVGSFVSTNQMRGRAIRTDPSDPDKVASVWHVAALVPDTPTGVMDLQQLRERFRTFVGLSSDGAIIESGLHRLALPEPTTARDIPAFNAETLRRHSAVGDVVEGWREAIEGAGHGKVVPTLGVARVPSVAPFHTRKTMRYLWYEIGWSGIMALGWSIADLARVDSLQALGVFLAAGSALAMVTIAPKLLRTLRMALRHLPVDGSVAQMGKALLEALRVTGLVDGPQELGVRVERSPGGGVTVALEGGTFYEQSLFADAMGELLGPVENPRYIITRQGEERTPDGERRMDFHAVPSCLGTHKERAEALLDAWRRYVGPGELIFTRREGGRELLLAARTRAFSSVFEDEGMRRLDRWQ